MSSNTANTLGIIKQVMNSGNTIPIQKRSYRLTEEQKKGIGKMMEYFDSLHNFGKGFEIHIGFLANGNMHLITLEGSAIVRHLGGVLEFEVYGEDGRSILNGIRECYSNDRFQMGFPIGS
jgi:hypothetical protein